MLTDMDNYTKLGKAADCLVDAAFNGNTKAMDALLELGALDDKGEADPEAKGSSPAQERAFIIEQRIGEDPGLGVSRFAINPSLRAALSTHNLLKKGQVLGQNLEQLDTVGLADALEEQVALAKNKDLDQGVGMLVAQAYTLDALFNHLLQKGLYSDYIDHLDSFMKLALRAQSQARSTWEAVSAIQNPLVAGYVKQANIAQNQQVNNDSTVTNGSRAREIENQPTELLEEEADEQWMDRRAVAAPERAYSEVEAVGEVDGAEDQRRQG